MNNQNETYHIYYSPEFHCVVMGWSGYATSNQFREGTELMLDFLVKHNCAKVLADIKDMVLIGREDQKWLETAFLPRAINFGFKVLAIVNSEHYFNRVAVESVSYKIDRDLLNIRFFDESSEAKLWLKEI